MHHALLFLSAKVPPPPDVVDKGPPAFEHATEPPKALETAAKVA